MSIHEPMTVATDYLLAVFAVVFGVRLWRADSRMWALAFVATAAASLLGGTYHGLAYEPLWKPTLYAIGLASLFLLAGLGRAFLIFGVAKFVVYAIWMATHDEFKYVIYDYGVTMLVVAGVALARRNHLILASVAVSVVAAAIQQSRFSLHQHFNHNDLYHVIQIVALGLLYRGALELRTTSKDRPTTQPT